MQTGTISMNHSSRSSTFAASYLLPVAAAAFAIDIFVVDTFTPLEGAVAVLYVVVVLIAANYLQRRGILLVSLGCVALTVSSYLVSHRFATNGALIRLLVSISAIAITTFLALRVWQQERQLQLTIDTIPTQAWHTRPDGFTEYLNKRWLDYTGLSLQEALGWDWKVALHPEDLPGFLDRRGAIMASGKGGEIEARLRRFDGEYRWFLFRFEPLRDDRENIIRWYGSNTDIEDIRRAEDALRRSEAYLAEAQRLSLTGSFGWKVASRQMFWSEETYRILGYEPTSQPAIELLIQRVHPDDLALVQRAIDRASQGAPDIDVSHRLLMPDGSVKHVKVLAHAATDQSSEPEYIGALMDVTAAKRAEEALQNTQAELARAIRITTLGELAASISHEVNQPLTGIVTNGDAGLRWLAREPPALDEVRSSVESMIDDAQRASEVIKRIRALSKKADPEKTSLDINDVIHDVVRLVQREVANHGASLRLDLATQLPRALGDRVQLQQVIINLVINGIQAMASVTDRPRELLVRSRRDGDHVLVAVEDAGVGINPEHVDRLFDAFFTTKPTGIGMGLSISHSIIEAHGGRIWASNHTGPGATFQFTVPTSRERAS
jgi:PAS domain S-box-containing protein